MAELNTLGAVIKQTYENETDTNAFTDAEKAKLGGVSLVGMSGSFNDLTNVPEFVELDDSGTIPMQYLNVSSLSFKGAWDAATNTPSLIDGAGAVGDFYKISVAGTHNFGNGDYIFAVGDWVMFAAGVWQRIGVHESVASVNGKTGIVVLTAADIGAKPASYVPAYADISGKPDFANLYAAKADINKASGIAPLDSDKRVPSANLPTYLPQTQRIWRSVVGSRVVGTFYTNNSGNEMLVSVSSNNTSAVAGVFTWEVRNPQGTVFTFTGASQNVGSNTLAFRVTGQQIVPVGWAYRITNAINSRGIPEWYELS